LRLRAADAPVWPLAPPPLAPPPLAPPPPDWERKPLSTLLVPIVLWSVVTLVCIVAAWLAIERLCQPVARVRMLSAAESPERQGAHTSSVAEEVVLRDGELAVDGARGGGLCPLAVT